MHTDRSSIPTLDLDLSGQIVDADVYELAHDAGWESCSLHDRGHVFLGWICSTSIHMMSCATSQNGMSGIYG